MEARGYRQWAKCRPEEGKDRAAGVHTLPSAVIIIIIIIVIMMMRVTSSKGAVIPRGKAFSRGSSSQSIVTYKVVIQLHYNCITIVI